MSYRFQRDETIPDGVRRIAVEQIDGALASLADREADRHVVVHNLRKRCKKIRGLLRLVRPQCEETYQFENAQFRDAARKLSGLRDAESVCESLEALIERFRTQLQPAEFDSTRQALGDRKREIAHTFFDLDDRLAEFRSSLETSRVRIPSWPFVEKGFSAVAAGLKKTYGRGRDSMPTVGDDPAVEDFHEWRKRVKYHWYHVRLLRNAWKPMLNVQADELKQLSDHLGDLHDLANLRDTLLSDPNRYGTQKDLQTLLGLIECRNAELAERACRLGARVFAEKPKSLVRRFKRYWKVWRQQRESTHGESSDEISAVASSPHGQPAGSL